MTLDEELRSLAQDRRWDVAIPADAATRAIGTVRRRRHGAYAAVAAMAAMAVGLGAALPHLRRDSAAPAAPAVSADGWRKVSSLGLEVEVPGNWPVNSWNGCSAPPPAEVSLGDGFGRGCGNSAFPTSHVSIGRVGPVSLDRMPLPNGPMTPQPRASSSRSTAGVPSVTQEFAFSSGVMHDIRWPSRDVELQVMTPNPAVRRRILDSVRFIAVDAAGCTTTAPADPAWDRRRTGPKVDLTSRGAPAELAVCLYTSGATGRGAVISVSTVLRGAQLSTAVAAIDAAAPGPSPDAPARTCRDRDHDTPPLWLHARYADGHRTDVRVRYATCTDLWVATADGISQVTKAQLAALLGPLRTGYGFIAALPER